MILEPCPLCGSRDLRRYRFTKAGFLDREGTLETVCQHGDFYRIECDCGCKFDKYQDDLFTRLEMAYGDYVEVTNDDLWNRLIADWNKRVGQ